MRLFRNHIIPHGFVLFTLFVFNFYLIWSYISTSLNYSEVKRSEIRVPVTENIPEKTIDNKPLMMDKALDDDEFDFNLHLYLEEKDGIKIVIDEIIVESGEVRISILDTITNKRTTISEPVSLSGSVKSYVSPDRQYVVLSSGTYVISSTVLISLKTGKIIIPAFAGRMVYFTDGFLIFERINEDVSYKDSGLDEYLDIVAMDLNTKSTKILFKADSLNQYIVEKVANNVITVNHYYVSNREGWATNENVIEETLYYQL